MMGISRGAASGAAGCQFVPLAGEAKAIHLLKSCGCPLFRFDTLSVYNECVNILLSKEFPSYGLRTICEVLGDSFMFGKW